MASGPPRQELIDLHDTIGKHCRESKLTPQWKYSQAHNSWCLMETGSVRRGIFIGQKKGQIEPSGQEGCGVMDEVDPPVIWA